MFTEIQTISAEEATNELFDQALLSVPVWEENRIQKEFEGFAKSWGSQRLIKGEQHELRTHVLFNLKKTTDEPGFHYFTVHVRDAMGLAQVIAWSDGAGTSVCLWQTAESLYLCGNSYFE
jgi:hypothetical protein